MIKQIGLPLRGHPILLITRTIIDRTDLHSVLLITTMYHSGGSARARSANEQSPIAKENWKPMDPRNFGYDVSVRPNAPCLYILSGWGKVENEFLPSFPREFCPLLFKKAF